ncbi:MAG: hypothetical protein AAGB34_11475 [Planctomycetota bacterium]
MFLAAIEAGNFRIDIGDWISVAALFTVCAAVVLIVAAGVGFPIWFRVTRAREAEQTKREIAAYIAEGSITPEDGERLLRAACEQTGLHQHYGAKGRAAQTQKASAQASPQPTEE